MFPAFGRAGADLTRPIDSPYFFLMAGTLVRVEGVRPSAGARYFPALRRAWDSRHIIPVRVTHSPCVQGYKRVQYQRNCAASAGVQERTINTR